MQLKKIQASLKDYKDHLQKQDQVGYQIFCESQWFFQNNWDDTDEDFIEMYDRSLYNSQTKRLWKGHNYFPKEMMLKMLRVQADYGWAMFRDLFDEAKDIDGRIGRFKAGCDELLRQYKLKYPLKVDNNHFHEDNQMIALYLAFRFPDQYAPFDYLAFKGAMQILGATKVPESFEIERYFKTSRTIFNFAQKEEGLKALFFEKLPDHQHFKQDNLMLVYDYYQYLIGYWNK